MTGSCIREEGGVSCWHMPGHIHTRSQSSISQRLTVRPRHISAVKAAMCDYKKELPSSLIKFLYWADLETHIWCVSVLLSVIWREDGSSDTDVLLYLCLYLSFVLLSPASPLKFDWCLVIYSFHLVCLLSLSLSLSVCVCVSYYIGRRPIVIIADPDMLRQVMVKEFNKFPNRMVSEWHNIYSLISNPHTQQFISSCIIKPEAYMHSKNDFLMSF